MALKSESDGVPFFYQSGEQIEESARARRADIQRVDVLTAFCRATKAMRLASAAAQQDCALSGARDEIAMMTGNEPPNSDIWIQ